MSRIRELRERQANILTLARQKLDEIKPDTPAERAREIEAEYDRAMADHDAIGATIDRELRLEAAQRAAEEARNAADARRPRGNGEAAPGARETSDGGVTYRDAFRQLIAAGGSVGDLEPEVRAVLRRGASEHRAQTAGTNSAGGYTVPTELASFIEFAMIATGPMYDGNVVTEINNGRGNAIKLPTIDDTSVAAVAHTEAGSVTDDGGSDVTVGQKSLDAFAFDTEWVRWSYELAQDSDWNWEQLLGQLLGERLGRIANAQLTTGTGSSAPNGIVTASTLGKTCAATGAVTADEIMDFVHSVDPAYRASPRARAMFNDATLLAIRKLKDAEDRYLIQTAPDGSGRLVVGSVSVPYSINQSVASMGAAAKFMVYGDFGRYYVRKAGAPVMFTARERFAPDLGMLGFIRFDGELANTAAVKHMKNAAS